MPIRCAAAAHWYFRCSVGVTTVIAMISRRASSSAAMVSAQAVLPAPGVATSRKSRRGRGSRRRTPRAARFAAGRAVRAARGSRNQPGRARPAPARLGLPSAPAAPAPARWSTAGAGCSPSGSSPPSGSCPVVLAGVRLLRRRSGARVLTRARGYHRPPTPSRHRRARHRSLRPTPLSPARTIRDRRSTSAAESTAVGHRPCCFNSERRGMRCCVRRGASARAGPGARAAGQR